jgi:hypothetical protein
MNKDNFLFDYQCPCCDYFTLERRSEYDICPICFWEDNGIDLDELDSHSGPNHMTLREGRQNFTRLGVCDIKMKKYVVKKEERLIFKYLKREIVS